MPLRPGSSRKVVSENIKKEITSGKPQCGKPKKLNKRKGLNDGRIKKA